MSNKNMYLDILGEKKQTKDTIKIIIYLELKNNKFL